MPKDIENSNKTSIYVTSDNSVVSLKSPSQPLSNSEKIALNKIYNESTMRLERTIEVLNQLEAYLVGMPDNKNAAQNIKQLLIDKNVNPDVLHTLIMLKRHFYINITRNTIQNILLKLKPIRDNLFKTYQGLKGQLDISLEILKEKPTQHDINQFKDKTYVLTKNDNTWSLSYYEKRIKKCDIPINEAVSNIHTINTIDSAELNRCLILRSLMLYHAKNVKSFTDKVYISNISLSKQNNPKNTIRGYVYARQLGSNEYFSAIHIDYRLLDANPFQALRTFIHESCHRYGWVNDRGYYHQTKSIKNTDKVRPYPKDVQADTLKATNNADSYSYFVCDITGPDDLYSSDNLPAWYKANNDKPLPSESFFSDNLLKYSLFASGAALVTGGLYLAVKNNLIKFN